MDVIVSLILALALVFITVKKRAFTPSAAFLAAFILVLSAIFASFAGIFIVIFAYGTIFAVDLILGKRSERITRAINKKSGARDVFQVLSNALAAILALAVGKLTGIEEFTVVYTVALTECLADSLASDVGVLSKKPPVDITTLRPIERGLSGGVSALGTLSAFVGCLLMSGFSIIFFGFSAKYFFSILLVPMIGVTIDSILGSRAQAKYTCAVCGKKTEKPVHCDTPCTLSGGIRILGNDAVNLLSNLITALIATLVLIIL
jgi:uncharacterized protein (TIGR00297 family)